MLRGCSTPLYSLRSRCSEEGVGLLKVNVMITPSMATEEKEYTVLPSVRLVHSQWPLRPLQDTILPYPVSVETGSLFCLRVFSVLFYFIGVE